VPSLVLNSNFKIFQKFGAGQRSCTPRSLGEAVFFFFSFFFFFFFFFLSFSVFKRFQLPGFSCASCSSATVLFEKQTPTWYLCSFHIISLFLVFQKMHSKLKIFQNFGLSFPFLTFSLTPAFFVQIASFFHQTRGFYGCLA